MTQTAKRYYIPAGRSKDFRLLMTEKGVEYLPLCLKKSEAKKMSMNDDKVVTVKIQVVE